VLAHYYETKPGLPARYEELREHAASMEIPLPAERSVKWTELRGRFIEMRKASGLDTPRSGPLPGQELSPEQVAVLLEGAPRMRRKGHWLVLDNVLDALAEYVEEYEGKEALRQHHYNAVCAGRGCIGTGDGPFRSMLELGRRRALKRRRKAA